MDEIIVIGDDISLTCCECDSHQELVKTSPNSIYDGVGWKIWCRTCLAYEIDSIVRAITKETIRIIDSYREIIL